MFRVARKNRVGRETGNTHIFFLGLSRLYGDGFMANETRIQTTGTTGVSTCAGLHIVSDALAEKRTRYKGAGKRSTGAHYNFWLACCTAGARLVCLFLSSPFHLLPIFFILKERDST